MNKKLKWTLIIGGIAFFGIGLYFILNRDKTESPPLLDSVNNNVDANMSVTAQNGNIIITVGGTSYTYKLEGYAILKWWAIHVNNIDLDSKKVTYTNPQNNQQSTETLEDWVITDIKNGLGSSAISMGETADGNKIRLTKV
jgi:hypothetical protein